MFGVMGGLRAVDYLRMDMYTLFQLLALFEGNSWRGSNVSLALLVGGGRTVCKPAASVLSFHSLYLF